MTLYLARRFCNHCRFEKPSETFRPLPGGNIKRWVCETCYERIMDARAQKRREGWTA